MAAYSAARFALCNDFRSRSMCAKSVRFKRYFHHPLRDGFGRKDAWLHPRMDYRRLHHHDECDLRGAADSDSEKKLRVGATLPARYRLYLRNVHRPQYGAYTVDGFRKYPGQCPCADCRLHHPRFRNCYGGEVRLSNHAWRGHFHRHSQGYRLAFPKAKIRVDITLVVLAVLFCFLLLGSWKWEIVGIGTLFAMVYVGVTVRLFNKHLAWFDRLLHYRPGCRRYVYGLARYIRRQM